MLNNSAGLPSPTNPSAVDSFVWSMLINACIAVILVLIFLLCRRRLPWIYSPRQDEEVRGAAVHPPPQVGNAWVSCFTVGFTVDEKELLLCTGPDAVIFIRFFRLCCLLFLSSCLAGSVVLLININGHNGKRGFELLSITNAADEHLVYHLAFAWFIQLIALYLMTRTWIGWVTIRHSYLEHIHSVEQNLTILVQNIPKKTRSDAGLSNYFHHLYPHNFHSSVIVKDVRRLTELLTRRQRYLILLEHSYGVWGETGIRPTVKEKKTDLERWWSSFFCSHHCSDLISFICSPCRSDVDAITYYTNKLKKYNLLVQQEQQKVSSIRSLFSGFVSFKTAVVANTAVKVEHNPRPFQYMVKSAPLVHDVYWPGLLLSRKQRLARQMISSILITIALICWSVPIAMINSLSDLQGFARTYPFLVPLVDHLRSIGVLPVIEGYLPSLALMLVMVILPVLLLRLCEWQGIEAHSWIQQSLLHKYFLFQIFNFFIVNALFRSLYALYDHFQHWQESSIEELLIYLSSNISGVAPFFINFIMLRSLTGFPLQLVRIWPLLYGMFSLRYKCKTERERRTVTAPPTCDYGEEYPEHMLIFTVGVTYAVIAPVVLPFIWLYFFLGYVCKVYQSLYMYVPLYESGGMLWPTVFQRLTYALLLSQITLIGYFALRQSSVCSTAMLPLLIITYVVNRYVWSAYWEKGRHLPVEIAEEVDIRRGEAAKLVDRDTDHSTSNNNNNNNLEQTDNTGKQKRHNNHTSEEKQLPANSRAPSSPVASRSVSVSVSSGRSLPEDNDLIQRSENDIQRKGKRQNRKSMAWEQVGNLAQTGGTAPTTSERNTLQPIRRTSLHPSLHIQTQSLTSLQDLDRMHKQSLHPYTQPELLAPAIVLPDIDAELRKHDSYADMIDAALAQDSSPFSPSHWDEPEEEQQQPQNNEDEEEEDDQDQASATTEIVPLPLPVPVDEYYLTHVGETGRGGRRVQFPLCPDAATSLLSGGPSTQYQSGGSASTPPAAPPRRRAWPSISFNMSEEWAEEEDV